jgi:hypothetical protein
MAKNSVKSSTQDFSKVVHANTPRSTFKRVSTLATTFNAGDLVPIYVDEILPGDTFKMDLQFVSRLLTPIVPVMDNFNVEFFAFFVPNRIVWDNWQVLMGENNSSAWTPSSPPASVPSRNSGVIVSKSLADYYGLPVGLDMSNHSVNLLPFRGYAKIWNDWFRNQNVQAPQAIPLDNSQGAGFNFWLADSLFQVNKPFDYFTSALPAPQKGLSQLIPIELNQLIPVIAGTEHTTASGGTAQKFRKISNGSSITNSNFGINGAGNSSTIADSSFNLASEIYPSNLYADGSGIQVSGSTINDLRTAFQIQRLYERDARGGTRYIEMLKAHFGVDAGDYRLQRPEYLGHCSTLMDITQVTQTSATETGVQATDLGTTGAYGHAQGDKSLFEKSFVEHGFIHIFAVARQKKTYQQGLDRFWTRRDRLDYYVPVLAHISEQPIYQSEIYALSANSGTVFGYQEAWSDYRYKPSRVTGQMRSGVTNSFDIWHYADIYASAPTLSDAWMQDNSAANIQRTLAVADADQILLNVRFDLEATRPMPTHSIPGLIDHF